MVGEPNAGKSTLVNSLVGTKVSIVSPKKQTTRFRVTGITVKGNSQIIFVDTPGIFSPSKRYDRAMVKTVWDEFGNADMVMPVIDVCRSKVTLSKSKLIKHLKNSYKPCVLVLNKVDLINKTELFDIASQYNEALKPDMIFMVSALKNNGTEDINNYLAENLPEGEWLYDEDDVSDFPMMLMVAEITREQIYHRLHDEIPYNISVKTDSWEEFDNGSIKISQTIHVLRSSQKGIVIGKQGSLLKKIGENARKEISEIIGTEIHLSLFVKVKENWMEDPSHYQVYGLDFES